MDGWMFIHLWNMSYVAGQHMYVWTKKKKSLCYVANLEDLVKRNTLPVAQAKICTKSGLAKVDRWNWSLGEERKEGTSSGTGVFRSVTRGGGFDSRRATWTGLLYPTTAALLPCRIGDAAEAAFCVGHQRSSHEGGRERERRTSWGGSTIKS